MGTGNIAHRVIFFGDSICVGQGVSIHKGWVTRLAQRIEEIAVEIRKDIVVINASINGNTTRQALERMPYDVQSHAVDILLIQFGMNDCNYWESDRGLPRVSAKAFAANLEEIVIRGRNFGARTVLVNTNHPTLKLDEGNPHMGIPYEENNRRYNQIIREVVASLNEPVVLNDVEALFLGRIGGDRQGLKNFLLPDGLHLSEQGHDLYFELIVPVMEDLLRNQLSHVEEKHVIAFESPR